MEPQHQAVRLLQELASTGRTLRDNEVDIVAAYLDGNVQTQVLRSQDGLPFHSANLGVGEQHRQTDLLRSQIAHQRVSTGSGDNSPGEHFDLEIQRAAFKFVKLDSRIEQRMRHPRAWIKLDNVARKFFAFQLYGAFWLLLQERGPRRGCILADLMGLGKTTTALLYILLNFLLIENIRDVQFNSSQHCRPSGGDHTQLPGTGCPSQHKWPIECWCVESSVSRTLPLGTREGASLLLIPASLLGNWQTEWRSFGVHRSLPIKLFIHHNAYRGRAVPRSWFYQLKLRINDSPGDTSATRRAPISGSAHRFIVMTSIESYYTHVQRFFGSRRLWRKPDHIIKDEDYTDCIAWARVLRDEAHMTPNWSTRLYRIMESLINNSWTPPNFLFLTATPMLRNGVNDMLSSVKLINLISPHLASHLECGEFVAAATLESMAAEHTRIRGIQSRGDPVPEATMESFTQQVGRLQAAYCLRRRNDSIQNGKTLAYVPPLRCYDVHCDVPGQENFLRIRQIEALLKKQLTEVMQDRIAQWRARGGGRVDSDQGPRCTVKLLLENALVSRILATVPGLTRYSSRKVLTGMHITAQKWHLDQTQSSMYQDIDDLIRSSGKLQKLQVIIRKLQVDADGQPEKLVIVSEFPMICLVVCCLCLRLKIDFEWMHASLDAAEREGLASVFQGLRPASPDVGKGKPFRVMIGTTRILGQGVTLHKAFRLVLMEPGRHAAVEAQIADRVHRIGSRTDCCWFYRLLNPDSQLEKLLVADQEGQVTHQLLAEWFNIPVNTATPVPADRDLERFLGFSGRTTAAAPIALVDNGEEAQHAEREISSRLAMLDM